MLICRTYRLMKKAITFPRPAVFSFKPALRVLRKATEIALFLIIFGNFSSYAVAGIREEQSISKMVQRADVIIRGEVIATESQWKEDSRGKHIYTSVTVIIIDKVKGNIQGDILTFEVSGGVVGDVGEIVSGTPTFTAGEDAIIFLGGSL